MLTVGRRQEVNSERQDSMLICCFGPFNVFLDLRKPADHNMLYPIILKYLFFYRAKWNNPQIIAHSDPDIKTE